MLLAGRHRLSFAGAALIGAAALAASPVLALVDAERVPLRIAAAGPAASSDARVASQPPLPRRLQDTGLFAPDSSDRVRDGVVAFSPQYPLWSDGTTKQRWMRLPKGAAIDASDPDAWVFPIGTRFWKEFSHGRRIETRMIERVADGSWRFATYVWNETGTAAYLAPAEGIRALPVSEAPSGRYTIPSREDCLACHEGPAVPILGFSALQLSPDRDPLAPHAEPRRTEHFDLRRLVDRMMLRNLPAQLLERPPRVAAASAVERAALGYLHANCGHCHNADGALAGLDLSLEQRTADAATSAELARASLFGQSSHYRPLGVEDARRVAADGGGHGVLTMRMRSKGPQSRMPPLGVTVLDVEGIALVDRWIREYLPPVSRTE